MLCLNLTDLLSSIYEASYDKLETYKSVFWTTDNLKLSTLGKYFGKYLESESCLDGHPCFQSAPHTVTLMGPIASGIYWLYIRK